MDELACPKCQEKFSESDVAFLCPEPRCRARDHPLLDSAPEWAGKPLFRPAAGGYDYSVSCPFSPHTAYVKICPRCWKLLPLSSGRPATVAIIGSTVSGKTCFMTALIRQIRRELARASAYEMSLEWDDQEGKDYFKKQEQTIFFQNELPEANQKMAPIASLQITVRFPVRRRWRRIINGKQGVVSLVFHDPSGEFFENMDDVYYLNFLGRAKAILLMVDPMMSEEYQKKLRDEGKPLPPYKAASAAEALGAFVTAMRRESKPGTKTTHNRLAALGKMFGRSALSRSEDKLDKQLAVVLTKCDEDGMFDPDHRQHRDRYPVQGREYDPALTQEISDRVAQHMEEDLGLAEVVALARQSFRRVTFFAASALGAPPLRIMENGKPRLKLKDPRPRRVEDPLLWILHEWGYL